MTQLSPLEEALFQSWTRANGIDNHDDPNNQFDHRGLYKSSNGLVQPRGVVANMANAHNKAMEPAEGGDTTFPDPYMAQAEMHKANLDSQSKQRSDEAKTQLEEKKMQHKLLIEQMKMQHQSQEKEKDRQHKAAQEQQARQMEAQARAQDMQLQQQQTQQQRQYAVEDAQTNRQHQVQDTMMQEHLTRTRPQPAPSGLPQPSQGTDLNGQPAPEQGSPQPAPPSTQGLQQQMMQRAMQGQQR